MDISIPLKNGDTQVMLGSFDPIRGMAWRFVSEHVRGKPWSHFAGIHEFQSHPSLAQEGIYAEYVLHHLLADHRYVEAVHAKYEPLFEGIVLARAARPDADDEIRNLRLTTPPPDDVLAIAGMITGLHILVRAAIEVGATLPPCTSGLDQWFNGVLEMFMNSEPTDNIFEMEFGRVILAVNSWTGAEFADCARWIYKTLGYALTKGSWGTGPTSKEIQQTWDQSMRAFALRKCWNLMCLPIGINRLRTGIIPRDVGLGMVLYGGFAINRKCEVFVHQDDHDSKLRLAIGLHGIGAVPETIIKKSLRSLDHSIDRTSLTRGLIGFTFTDQALYSLYSGIKPDEDGWYRPTPSQLAGSVSDATGWLIDAKKHHFDSSPIPQTELEWFLNYVSNMANEIVPVGPVWHAAAIECLEALDVLCKSECAETIESSLKAFDAAGLDYEQVRAISSSALIDLTGSEFADDFIWKSTELPQRVMELSNE